MFLLLEVPHTPPKRNTFSFGLYNWNGDIEFVPKIEYEQLHSRSACSTGIPIGACFLFFVFLVRIDASPVICGRPVGHPCTTFPSLGQSGICAMRPPRPAYGIYALCSLHFAAYFMQPFFKTTINFTFASQIFWLASSSFFHFLSIVDHQVKETKLIYCFPKITACSNHKATNLHEVTWTS